MMPSGFCCVSRSTGRNGVINICTVQEQCVFKHDTNIFRNCVCMGYQTKPIAICMHCTAYMVFSFSVFLSQEWTGMLCLHWIQIAHNSMVIFVI